MSPSDRPELPARPPHDWRDWVLAAGERVPDWDRVAATRPKVPAALRAWMRLAAHCGLDPEGVCLGLGVHDAGAVHRWLEHGTADIPLVVIERLSLILGTYAGLARLYGPRSDHPVQWLREAHEHEILGDRTPLEVLLSEDVAALRRMRALVDAAVMIAEARGALPEQQG